MKELTIPTGSRNANCNLHPRPIQAQEKVKKHFLRKSACTVETKEPKWNHTACPFNTETGDMAAHHPTFVVEDPLHLHAAARVGDAQHGAGHQAFLGR